MALSGLYYGNGKALSQCHLPCIRGTDRVDRMSGEVIKKARSCSPYHFKRRSMRIERYDEAC